MRSRVSLLSIAFVSALTFACGKKSSSDDVARGKTDSGVDSRLFGSWRVDPRNVNHDDVEASIVIEPGRAGISVKCLLDNGGSITANAMSAANIQTDSIEVLSEVEAVEKSFFSLYLLFTDYS